MKTAYASFLEQLDNSTTYNYVNKRDFCRIFILNRNHHVEQLIRADAGKLI